MTALLQTSTSESVINTPTQPAAMEGTLRRLFLHNSSYLGPAGKPWT